MNERTAGTGGSRVVEACQVCASIDLKPIVFLGYLPPVNTMPRLASWLMEQTAYPALVLQCGRCGLVQMGLVVDPHILFPSDYPYTSGSTAILRDNFAQLAREVMEHYPLSPDQLVVDIGSNDGTLLSNFVSRGMRVLGIEPTDKADLASARGIPSVRSFFSEGVAQTVVEEYGKAHLVTATNVFAHIEDIHAVMHAVKTMLSDDGLFVTESHYLASLVETLQFDTIYHEHLRYYSLAALSYLLSTYGFEVVRARRIPTHGGSIRVYAARVGARPIDGASVAEMMQVESRVLDQDSISRFGRRVAGAKSKLLKLLTGLYPARIYGVGAPSRASTLISYVGLDDGMLECVLETPQSQKIGRYMPGTLIPVVDEVCVDSDPPDYLLLLSWHIADELIPKLRARGYRGRFIVPLPEPRIVS